MKELAGTCTCLSMDRLTLTKCLELRRINEIPRDPLGNFLMIQGSSLPSGVTMVATKLRIYLFQSLFSAILNDITEREPWET